MSRVVITELQKGTLATSTDVNATLVSWNSATAAGQIDAGNVRAEGIGRRMLKDGNGHTVYSAAHDFYGTILSSGLVDSVGVYAPVTIGGAPVRIGPLAFPANANVLVHCAGTFVLINNSLLQVRLESSPDNATWTAVTGTRRRFATRDLSALADWNVAPYCRSSIDTHTGAVTGGAITRYFRLAFQTANVAAVNFSDITLYAETLVH